MRQNLESIRIVDSHTGGEPTRVVVAGGPELGGGSVADRLALMREQFDHYRRAIVLEPRGFDAVVAAIIVEPQDPAAAAGVIFFNNHGYLNMCGHGAIGVAVTLGYLDRIGLGVFNLETAVGMVSVELHTATRVSVGNVPSYRYLKAIELPVEGYGTVVGDVAWGGNWFFLVDRPPVPIAADNLHALTEATKAIRRALETQGITGANGAEIDHIELCQPLPAGEANMRNFVLCPGGEYDRSPCGTGTSAKLACLAADGKLQPGDTWVQESVIGSRFAATYQPGEDGRILPTITGEAYICGEGDLLIDSTDPFRHGIVTGGGR